MITVVDYKLNNLRSLENTLRRLGHDVLVTSNPDDVRNATKLILPGVGAFGDGMRSLNQFGLAEPFIEKVKSGTPTLGICLGMHLLFTESDEFGHHHGLNLLEGRIVKLPAHLRVPHMGWNQLHPKGTNSLTAGVEGNCLVERHQRKSFPKLVADQLGISDFQQPLLGELPLTSPGTGVCLGTVVSGNTITVGPVSNQGFPQNATLARPYDNLGIPGANAADLVDLRVANPGGGTAARAATLILRNAPTQPFEGRSALDEANLLSPDLVTVWIGNNDVLGAALSAAAIEGVTLTPVATFDAKFTQLMTGLRASGRRIVALNIPDVSSIAFTRTSPPVVVNPATRQPVLVNGQPVSLLGPRTTATCPTAPCPLPAGTLVTLGASPLLGAGVGVPPSLGGTGAPLRPVALA